MRRPRSTRTRYSPRIARTPDESELLAEGRQREVRVDLRDRDVAVDERQAVPETHPEQPAAGEGVQALDHLEAGAQRIGERIEPDVEPLPDGVEQVRHQDAPEHEQDQADDDEADPRRRHVQHREEDAEEQQGRARGRAG